MVSEIKQFIGPKTPICISPFIYGNLHAHLEPLRISFWNFKANSTVRVPQAIAWCSNIAEKFNSASVSQGCLTWL